MLIGIILTYYFSIDYWIAYLIAFVVFVIYVFLVVRKVENERKILIKKYLESGDEEALEKAFPNIKSYKKE